MKSFYEAATSRPNERTYRELLLTSDEAVIALIRAYRCRQWAFTLLRIEQVPADLTCDDICDEARTLYIALVGKQGNLPFRYDRTTVLIPPDDPWGDNAIRFVRQHLPEYAAQCRLFRAPVPADCSAEELFQALGAAEPV